VKNLQQNPDALGALRCELQAYLQTYRGARVLYLPNPGNGGDSLIAAATFQAFARAEITYSAIDLDADVEGEVVFLGGGGNLIPLYDNIQTAYETFLGRARRIVLLPHTVRGNEKLLGRLDGSCTLFVRDVESYAHVLKVNPSLDVRLTHDMAFHLDVDEFLGSEALTGPGRELLKSKLSSVGVSVEALRAWPSVDMLRLDRESTAVVPVSDVDISDLFMLGVGPHEAPLAAWCFLKAIAQARHINTDRLHVAIGSALLGIPCTLRDNSYGKNAAVFQHSLKAFGNLRLAASSVKRETEPQSPSNAERLRVELEEVQAVVSGLAESASRSEQENVLLRARLGEAAKAAVELRATLDGLEAKVQTLEGELDGASTEAIDLQAKLDADAIEHSGLLARCQTLAAANATLRAMVTRNESAQQEVTRLGAVHLGLVAQHAEQGETLNAARAELELLRPQAAAQQSRIEALLASTSWRITGPLRWLRRMRS
jgi:exopolysaccharide biosynthesis predicted pyruvyltransferase EpsI